MLQLSRRPWNGEQRGFDQAREAALPDVPRPVRTGLASGPLTEVFGDLRPGDAVATRGTDEIRPGTDVRTKETKAIS